MDNILEFEGPTIVWAKETTSLGIVHQATIGELVFLITELDPGYALTIRQIKKKVHVSNDDAKGHELIVTVANITMKTLEASKRICELAVIG